jgi:hypothetical protein
MGEKQQSQSTVIAKLQTEKDILLFSFFALLFVLWAVLKNNNNNNNNNKERKEVKIRVQKPKTRSGTMMERGASTLTQVFTHQSDVFRAHLLPKLNDVDVKFLNLVSRETKEAIHRARRKTKKKSRISDFTSISTLRYAMDRISKYDCNAPSEQYVCSEVAATGRLDILKWLVGAKRLSLDERTLEQAAERGHLECLVYARKERGCRWTEPHEGEYFCESCGEWHEDEDFEPSDRPIELAALNGHIECVRFCHEEECPYQDEQLAINTVLSQNIDLLEYVHETMEVELFCGWQSIVEEAAEIGFLEGLKYLKEHSESEWEDVDQEVACTLAAANGHLQCLKYLHENEFAWDADVCNSAYKNGHMECFEFAKSKGCAFDESLLRGTF